MLIFGSGDNDRLRTGFLTTTGAKVGKPTGTKDANLLTFQLMTTDGNGVQTGTHLNTDGTITAQGGAAGGVQGTWAVYASNSYPDDAESISGATWNLGLFNNITADISPAIPASTGTGQNYLLTMPDWGFRHILFVFTVTSGQGASQKAWVYGLGKDYSH